jgi:molybdate transport system substrate-binding protein
LRAFIKSFSLLYLLILFSGCQDSETEESSKRVVNVAIAANVSYAIDELKREFNRLNPDIEVRTTLGSSGKLTAQIMSNAPYELFMSANMLYPNTLYRDRIAITKPLVYAQGRLALFSKDKRNLSRGLQTLKDENVSRVAIANPKTAPYGVASVEALKAIGIYEDVKGKFVYGESISQTVSYTTAVTDLGLVAKSSLYNPKLSNFKKGENWVGLDNGLYTPINQGIVILKAGKDSCSVRKFYDFMLSKEAETVLQKYGYSVPEKVKN